MFLTQSNLFTSYFIDWKKMAPLPYENMAPRQALTSDCKKAWIKDTRNDLQQTQINKTIAYRFIQ